MSLEGTVVLAVTSAASDSAATLAACSSCVPAMVCTCVGWHLACWRCCLGTDLDASQLLEHFAFNEGHGTCLGWHGRGGHCSSSARGGREGEQGSDIHQRRVCAYLVPLLLAADAMARSSPRCLVLLRCGPNSSHQNLFNQKCMLGSSARHSQRLHCTAVHATAYELGS